MPQSFVSLCYIMLNLLPLSDNTVNVLSFLAGPSSLEAPKEACVTNVISPSCGVSSVATKHCCQLSKRSTLFLCLVPNLLGSGDGALVLFLMFLLGFKSLELGTAPPEFDILTRCVVVS